MKLVSILNEDLIFCGLEGADRREIYGTMLRKALDILDLSLNSDALIEALLEREDSTMIPYEGMAIPHLRVPEISDLYVVVGLLKEPVKLKDNDLKPTSVVVMSIISENTSAIYLKSLAAFTRFFSNANNLAASAACKSAEEFFAILDGLKLKKDITAEDVMRTLTGVKADDRLSLALDIFNKESRAVLPVVDDQNRLIGEISALDIIRSFIPEYILMMDNLKFLSSFDMFDKIFKEEGIRYVRDYMKKPRVEMSPEVPLIQFTVMLAKQEAGTIFVVDDQNCLLGEISVRNIIHKIIRG